MSASVGPFPSGRLWSLWDLMVNLKELAFGLGCGAY
jgi:hypothetical protein